ncbi:MAG: hypothetical protein KDA80_04075 [Planctomycetaceae bacterium]|nr:hypothetical protein [Planctomycetaceae bacterium]
MSQSPENLTLHDKLSEADKLVRELIHHLESGFIPKAHGLRRTAREGRDPTEMDEVTDLTIRNSVEVVVQSDAFSREVGEKLHGFLMSIDHDVDAILGNR